MWLIRMAMMRPVTIMVAVLSIAVMSVVAVMRMKVDIFPDLNVPMISVVQPYGGMDPAQMEGFLVTAYEQHFFYISGVDHVSSKSIQSCAIMNIYFQPGVDMADAMAQVVAQVERSRAYMPPGTVTPFILRFDVGNVPVGFLVFSSPTRTLGEIQDLAYARVRPVVSTIPGVSTPPPFGGNQRSIVITIDSEKLRQYHLSLEDVVRSLTEGNLIVPSGVVRTGDLQRIAKIDTTVDDIQTIADIPLKLGSGASVYFRDVAKIEDTTDITTGYALVNGRRAVYMAISKQSSASTLAVVEGVKKNIAYMQSLLPEDIHVSFEFDQSVYVTEAIRGVIFEGGLGAVLTGLTVLLFLGDWRSALVVVMNIPVALLAAIVGLWATGQTINIMTLGGLSLSVGILVDEATVAIENIHTHIERGTDLALAIFDACCEVVTPQLLAMLSVISVFMPSFFMTGSTQALFVPLSLAVGFAMVASYVLSNTFVPVVSAWILKGHGAGHSHNQIKKERHKARRGIMDTVRIAYKRLLVFVLRMRVVALAVYLIAMLTTVLIYPTLGSEIFPAGNPTGFQLRMKAPAGTRFERTEEIARQVLDVVAETAGRDNLDISIGYVGTQPPSYAVSNVYIWTSGPQEAVLMVALKKETHLNMRELQEKLRGVLARQFPDVRFTFEAGDIINQIMNFGSPTPIQIDVDGPNFANDELFARKVLDELKELDYLRDVGIVQPLKYPTVNITIDRERAGQLGVTARDVGKAEIAATYSSRFVEPVFWRDAKSGLAYQVQIEVPQTEMKSIKDIEDIPVKTGGFQGPFLRDAAKVNFGTMIGEYDHYNMRRMITITANIKGDDLGFAARQVDKVLAKVGKPPRGVRVSVRGQVPTMKSTFEALGSGVVFAVVVIVLMLLAYFQSFPLAFAVTSVIPAIIFGAVAALWLTSTTVNVQSFMGTIMAIGVGVANAILVIVFAEKRRMLGLPAGQAAIIGAVSRLRPVLMTSIAMIAGMVPMALGLGEGGERTAPLGRAVIGGLVASTTAVLLVLPAIYAMIRHRAGRQSVNLLAKYEANLAADIVETRS
jgi:multidrug efflux pump subunit AcrB